MTAPEEFFIIFSVTVILTRLFLWFEPIPSPTVGGLRLHHWMFGAVGLIAGLVVGWMPLYAVGLGLFVDELTFILIGGKTHRDNYSTISLLGTFLLLILVFLLRGYLVFPSN